MEDTKKYLLPEADGLPTRGSQDYARYKLETVRHYLTMVNTAMHTKPWYARNYLDLQAGPGKIDIGRDILLGSPLIALTAPYPADQFIFNELNDEPRSALRARITASSLQNRVALYGEDINEVVDKVCANISRQDNFAQSKGIWSTFNIAFLDPEGLELQWKTVAKLAQMRRMDLIITFSTQGLVRNIPAGNHEIVTKFFGTPDWQPVYEQAGTMTRRALIDFYRKNLEKFGYHIEIDPEWGSHDLRFKNSKNVEVYSLIFASKDPLGDKLWKEAGTSSQPPRLPGLE